MKFFSTYMYTSTIPTASKHVNAANLSFCRITFWELHPIERDTSAVQNARALCTIIPIFDIISIVPTLVRKVLSIFVKMKFFS